MFRQANKPDKEGSSRKYLTGDRY